MADVKFISIDGMGGDHAPRIVIEGLERFAKSHPDFAFLVHGDKAELEPLLDKAPTAAPRVTIRHTDKRVAMDAKPSQMLRQGKGAIVNVASVNAFRPMDGQACYSLTKAAIVNMTQGLAREWARGGIRVNALVPGIVETRFAAALHEDPKHRATLERLVPMGRIAQPEEMAGAVVYLASDAASYTTGSCLTVDGGWLA